DVFHEEAQRLSDPLPRLLDRAPLRVTPGNLADARDPPAVFVALVLDRVSAHGRDIQRGPRQGARSRSIVRSSPGPRSSPAWTGTVVTQWLQRTRTCDPRWRISEQPSIRSTRSSSFGFHSSNPSAHRSNRLVH